MGERRSGVRVGAEVRRSWGAGELGSNGSGGIQKLGSWETGGLGNRGIREPGD